MATVSLVWKEKSKKKISVMSPQFQGCSNTVWRERVPFKTKLMVVFGREVKACVLSTHAVK